MVPNALGQVVGIQHAVDIKLFQLAAQVRDQLLFAHAGQIAETDDRIGAPARAQEGEFQALIVQPAADQRKVGHEALGKALARAGKHPLVFRLGGGPDGKTLGIDHDWPRVPLGEHDRVAIEEGGEQFAGVGLHAAVVYLEDGLGKFVGGDALAVRANDRTDHALVDGDGVDHAVEEEHSAGKPLVTYGTPDHKGIISLENRLHQADVGFKIGGKRYFIHSFTPLPGVFCTKPRKLMHR